MHTFLKSVFALMYIASANLVHAAIIEGHFSGKVLYVYENADVSPAYPDYFSPDALNSNFSGSFRYDTDLMPPNLVPEFTEPNQTN